MLNYNEVVQKKVIVFNDEPYEVISSHVFRKQQRKPVNQTKLKHLKTGKVTEQSFHASDKVEEADIETKQVKFLYQNKGEYWFNEPTNSKDRFNIKSDVIPESFKFIKENTIVDMLLFEENTIGFKLPIKVDLKVIDAPPAVRGNTAHGGVKQVKLETGALINTPLFINEGDILKINTETGEYTERVEKK